MEHKHFVKISFAVSLSTRPALGSNQPPFQWICLRG